ncbi:MAG: tRNA (N6-isopentenyl adenosine(37)-C2)-methylthiotransferase MiaB [Desulfobacteraceae bacterium]|jgi:tRNA-2-methylthio-N6-dimethylallyladenosine synthase|nr:MAG: tRNA (N6-isopentenyl adenosine(37)-C2)-methylthiotransferase MiaB [Desulfobacteraceae bacterium]
MTSSKVFVHTIGCQMNVYDSERMLQQMYVLSVFATDVMDDADVIIINTCAIREKAVQKVYSFLGRLTAIKRKRPEVRVIVAGCVAQQMGSHLIQRFPFIDIVLGTHAVHRLPEYLKRLDRDGGPVIDTEMTADIPEFPADMPVLPQNTVSRHVTIMRGCDNFCTYCVVPYVRGREVSRRPEDIICEIKMLVGSGVKEVTLLGQNVNSYGIKEGLVSFPRLLRQVNDLIGLERIRFVTSHPKDLSEDLMNSFARLDKLCNHIHLPVQSGSNRILAKMNRKYNREIYMDKVEKLRAISPGIAVTTDIIAGFPGETDDDFEQTIDLMTTVGFDHIFAFAYSDRPETPASRFPEKVPDPVKGERLRRALETQEGITRQAYDRLIGQVFPVMVEGYSKNQIKSGGVKQLHYIELSGRTPENRIVNFHALAQGPVTDIDFSSGRIQNVKIERACENSLWGTAVDPGDLIIAPKGGEAYVA